MQMSHKTKFCSHMLTYKPLTCTNMTARPAYLPADKVEEAVSGGDPVDVVGLVPRAVVHPHQHVPLGFAIAAVGIDAAIYEQVCISFSSRLNTVLNVTGLAITVPFIIVCNHTTCT